MLLEFRGEAPGAGNRHEVSVVYTITFALAYLAESQ
jgi:hypothetical protein